MARTAPSTSLVPLALVVFAHGATTHAQTRDATRAAAPDAAVETSSEALGRSALDQGILALQARRFSDAETALREALALRPTPLTRYNLALALRGLGRYIEAVALFDAYLAAPEDGASPARLQAIRAEVDGLRRAVVRLTVRLHPADATLRVDGHTAHVEEGVLSLDPGTHAFDIEAPGFEPERRDLTFTLATRGEFSVTLRALPDEGRLVVEPSASGAVVSLDGRVEGPRVDRRVAPGEHTVEVRAPGRAVWTRAVQVQPRATLRLDVALAPAGGMGPSRGWVLPVVLGGVGVAVVAGVITAIAFATRGDEPPVQTSWGTIPIQ
jgi:hypothetical protein